MDFNCMEKYGKWFLQEQICWSNTLLQWWHFIVVGLFFRVEGLFYIYFYLFIYLFISCLIFSQWLLILWSSLGNEAIKVYEWTSVLCYFSCAFLFVLFCLFYFCCCFCLVFFGGGLFYFISRQTTFNIYLEKNLLIKDLRRRKKISFNYFFLCC